MLTTLKYKKITIDNDIYISVFSYGTVSYPIVYTDDVLNNTNEETEFPELIIVFEEDFGTKFQEGSFLNYLNYRICQSPLGLSVDQIDHIVELVN